MTHKNNKKNKRRVAFYEINKFDYKVREKLVEKQLSPKKTYINEKEKLVELRLNYQ